MSILDRFCKPDDKLLIDALTRQTIVGHNRVLAKKLSSVSKLEEFHVGAIIIKQDDSDNDAMFILIGAVEIIINGRTIGERHAGQHVGEMALIDPSARRVATVIAKTQTAIARVGERDFSAVATDYPDIWRLLAVELADRLRQRSRFIRIPNIKPHLFIGSSREALPIAEQIKIGLSNDAISVMVWTDGVFTASSTSIESLEAELGVADFAVLVLSPDDIVQSRGTTMDSPRDNVIFELGLFMGSITRQRTYLVQPAEIMIKIPSDLLGAQPIKYSSNPETPISLRLNSACEEISNLILSKGPR